MMTGRNAIFGIGKPTEMIGSKNQRAMTLREIAMPSSDAGTAAISEADQRAIERDAGVDDRARRTIASAPDALEHRARATAA